MYVLWVHSGLGAEPGPGSGRFSGPRGAAGVRPEVKGPCITAHLICRPIEYTSVLCSLPPRGARLGLRAAPRAICHRHPAQRGGSRGLAAAGRFSGGHIAAARFVATVAVRKHQPLACKTDPNRSQIELPLPEIMAERCQSSPPPRRVRQRVMVRQRQQRPARRGSLAEPAACCCRRAGRVPRVHTRKLDAAAAADDQTRADQHDARARCTGGAGFCAVGGERDRDAPPVQTRCS
jgi:hypothetical protein